MRPSPSTSPPELRAVMAALLDISRGHLWLLPMLVTLSLIAFGFEGLAIYLLWPLIDTLAQTGVPGNQGTAPPLIFQSIEEALAGIPSEDRIFLLVAAIVVCIVVKCAFNFGNQASFAYANARIADTLRRRCFDDILAADCAFLDRQKPGALLNSLATQTWSVSQGLQSAAMMITHASATAVFVGLMLAMSWKMTLLISGAVVAGVYFVQLVTRPVRRLGEQAVASNERLTGEMVENMAGLRTLRLFNAEGAARCNFAKASEGVRRSFLRMDLFAALPAPALEIIFAFLLGMLLLFASRGGGLGSVVVLLALLFRLQPHAGQLMHMRTILISLAGALANLKELRSNAHATAEVTDLPAAPAVRSALAFENVSFAYPEADRPALDTVSFCIPARQVTAIAGRSGSGKSTALRLICRLSAPNEGRLTLDGQDLSGFNAASWRRRCAVVPQEAFLFNTTLAVNIALGQPQASRDDIETAAHAAHAAEFIEALPDGYDTVVGDRGLRLSGGQRQRIALARALIRNPEILILDEATNALDSLSERMVTEALEALRGTRTVIMVAHRLNSIQRADQVVVLREGRVAETGAPSALMHRGSEFHALFASQRQCA